MISDTQILSVKLLFQELVDFVVENMHGRCLVVENEKFIEDGLKERFPELSLKVTQRIDGFSLHFKECSNSKVDF
jgi:hypothetical protein